MEQRLLEDLALRLVRAEREHRAHPPLTAIYPDMNPDDAYRVQQLLVEQRLPDEGPIVGYKVGLTSRAMQELFGIAEPDYGPILNSMIVVDGGRIHLADLIAPRVEAEIAFVLARSLRGPGIRPEHVLDACRGVSAAIEVIDSRIEGWRIKLPDTVADLASSARVVMSKTVVAPDGLDLAAIKVTVARNGKNVSEGLGAAVLGHPATAVAWLINTLSVRGVQIPAGCFAMSGALHAAIPVNPGDTFVAEFDSLGPVSVAFDG